MHVLVVEDDPPVRHACAEIASSLGYQVGTADSVPAAREALAHDHPDLILLDMRLPGGTGASLLDEIRTTHPRASVVVMTAFATVNSAVDVMRNGATDFLAKPFALDELSAVLARAAEHRQWSEASRALQDRLRAGKGVGMLAGQSPVMEKLTRILSKVAFTSHPVLVLGEGGTGKESVARAIHGNGPHALHPFVPVDCLSLAPSLLEAELFGFEKAPLPGGEEGKLGLLAAAGEGTVFFDDIDALSPELQSKLLRVLQDRVIRPLGGGEASPMRARVLAASSRDLVALVETGRFRKDLFYRLNVVNIRVPPLRERKEDIPLLAAQVLERMRRERGMPYTFSDETTRFMLEYDWPGNVRELELVLERACALSSGPLLHLADLPTQLQNFERDSRERALELENVLSTQQPEGTPVLTLQELEKQAIVNALQRLKGDKIHAAKLLGIGKTTLYRKLKEYSITEDVH